jgi:hypothetical protein
MRITGGGDVPGRFMQQQVDLLNGGAYRLAIDTHFVMFRVNAGSRGGGGNAIYLDAPGGDQFFGVAAGSDAGMC